MQYILQEFLPRDIIHHEILTFFKSCMWCGIELSCEEADFLIKGNKTVYYCDRCSVICAFGSCAWIDRPSEFDERKRCFNHADI